MKKHVLVIMCCLNVFVVEAAPLAKSSRPSQTVLNMVRKKILHAWVQWRKMTGARTQLAVRG